MEAKCPFTIVIDSREQLPWHFLNIKGDAKYNHKRIEVPTVWKKLDAGDYSILGMENLVAVERKNISDCFNSCGQGRARFQREMQRLAMLAFAAVVIEADWDEIRRRPPEHTRLRPKVVYRTALSWSVRYGVQWWAMPGRGIAELTCFRMLEKFWEQNQKKGISHVT